MNGKGIPLQLWEQKHKFLHAKKVALLTVCVNIVKIGTSLRGCFEVTALGRGAL
jgi:hypothetical protein